MLYLLNLSALAGACVLFIIYYFLINKFYSNLISQKQIMYFSFAWLLVFVFEFYFLGPYSFIELSHEGNLNVSATHFLSHGHDGGRFSHQFGGGQDIYSMLMGTQYVNPDLLLSHFFPTWVVILLHKVLDAVLGFGGSYLLAQRVVPNSRIIALSIASVFPVSHFYLLNYSTNWGTGFSILPLVVYACVVCSKQKNFYRWISFSALIVAAAEPIHVFPTLVIAICGYSILHKDVNIKRVALGISILAIASFLSWHEFLYANFQAATDTARTIKTSNDFFRSLWDGIYILTFSWVVTFLYLIGISILAAHRDWFAMRSLVVLTLLVVIYASLVSFPWESFGLAIVNKLSHYYILISVTVLFIPVVARALAILQNQRASSTSLVMSFKFEVVVLAIGLSVMSWYKIWNMGNLAWHGGQGSFFGFETLAHPKWNPDRNSRVVTLFDTPRPNIVAAFYNFDSFDGATNLRSKRWDDYWFEIMHRDKGHILGTRTGIKWQLWNGKTYNIENHIKLNLLGIANVRYIFSALPLKTSQAKLISSPEKGGWSKVRPNFFANRVDFILFRLQRIFDPGPLYIYELHDVLPRVFSATSIDYVSNSISPSELHKQVSRLALSRTAIMSNRFSKLLPIAKSIEITAWKKIMDGFDISVEAPNGGLVVINNSYLPFWSAYVDGVPTQIFPANGIHMGIPIPAGAKSLRVKYERPLLREKLMESLVERF
jgi:hypothetical protein